MRALLRLGATDVLPLFGTGAGEWDRSLFLALARFGGMPCVVLGQDRRAERAEAPLGPSGLRVARRGMKLATELGLPLVSVIDTDTERLSAPDATASDDCLPTRELRSTSSAQGRT